MAIDCYCTLFALLCTDLPYEKWAGLSCRSRDDTFREKFLDRRCRIKDVCHMVWKTEQLISELPLSRVLIWHSPTHLLFESLRRSIRDNHCNCRFFALLQFFPQSVTMMGSNCGMVNHFNSSPSRSSSTVSLVSPYDGESKSRYCLETARLKNDVEQQYDCQ